jgi:hypothetical protein
MRGPVTVQRRLEGTVGVHSRRTTTRRTRGYSQGTPRVLPGYSQVQLLSPADAAGGYAYYAADGVVARVRSVRAFVRARVRSVRAFLCAWGAGVRRSSRGTHRCRFCVRGRLGLRALGAWVSAEGACVCTSVRGSDVRVLAFVRARASRAPWRCFALACACVFVCVASACSELLHGCAAVRRRSRSRTHGPPRERTRVVAGVPEGGTHQGTHTVLPGYSLGTRGYSQVPLDAAALANYSAFEWLDTCDSTDRTDAHARTQTYTLTKTHTHTPTHARMYAHERTHAHTNTHTLTQAHTQKQILSHAHAHTLTRSHAQTHMHAHIHSRSHTTRYTHAHTWNTQARAGFRYSAGTLGVLGHPRVLRRWGRVPAAWGSGSVNWNEWAQRYATNVCLYMYVHAQTHGHAPTHAPAYRHTHTRARALAHTCVRTPMDTDTHTNTHKLAYLQARTHARTRPHRCSEMQPKRCAHKQTSKQTNSELQRERFLQALKGYTTGSSTGTLPVLGRYSWGTRGVLNGLLYGYSMGT